MHMFAIVEFTDSKEVAVVPVTWLNEEEYYCAWPRTSKEIKALSSLIRKEVCPGQSWKNFQVVVFGKASE